MKTLEQLNSIEKEFNKYFEIASEANKKILEFNIKEIKQGLTKKEMYDRAIALLSRANAEFEMNNLKKAIEA